MNIFGNLYQSLFYFPLLRLFLFFLAIFKNYFWAIFFLTLFIKIIFFPLTIKNIRMQKHFQKLQTEREKIEEKYKKDPQKKAEEILSLYKREKISFLSLFFLFFQIPIFFALYQIFLEEIKKEKLPFLLKTINLAKPSYFLAFLAFFSQMVYHNSVPGKEKRNLKRRIWQNLPLLITLLIFLKLPAAFNLYWIFFNFLSIIEYRIYVREE